MRGSARDHLDARAELAGRKPEVRRPEGGCAARRHGSILDEVRDRRCRSTGPAPEDEQAADAVRRHLDHGEPEILCRACGHGITRDRFRVSVDGRHVHRRVNPFGIEFEFGCFREAPGVKALGDPTTEHTWFPGHVWSYSTCAACAAHLGWRFESEGASFHGLILERLAEGR